VLIGRIFAYWALVYFGQFCENNISIPNFWATCFQYKNNLLILTKNGFGYVHFGRFFSQTYMVPLIIVYTATRDFLAFQSH
jgi:hypothetical protein